MPSSSRRSASAVWITASNSFERWLISITDIPVPLKSINSACAFSSTSSGRTPGPGLKLKTRLGLDMECTPVFIDLQTRRRARDHPIETQISTLHFIILFVRQIIKNDWHISHLIYVVDTGLSRK